MVIGLDLEEKRIIFMNEQKQIKLIKFITDHTIYVNIPQPDDPIGFFAHAITDISVFVDDLMIEINKK